jgi:hypothetical protein
MEIEHRNYLDLHRPNYEMVQNGYVRNIDLEILKMYEHIYRKYVSDNYVLTVWCSHCIFDLVKRLYEWYDLQPKPKKDNPKQMNGIESEAPFVKTRKRK